MVVLYDAGTLRLGMLLLVILLGSAGIMDVADDGEEQGGPNYLRWAARW